MEPGDSVLCDKQTLATSYRNRGHARGWKMAVRKIEGGWRVWRVE